MKKVKLGDIVDIFNGSTPSTRNENNYGGEIPWITPKDLSDLKLKYVSRGERNITDIGLKEIGGNLLPEGTILFTSRAPIGLISIAANEVTTNQGFKNMVCKKDKVNNEYLFYLLKIITKNIQKLGTGTTFSEVSKSTIENMEIYIEENVSTQSQIASILSSLDDKIELNNKINTELEEMAKTLYDYWFVQFEFPYDFAQGKPNENGKPYKSSGGKMVWNEELKREVPEGWEVKRLEEVADITMGQSPSGTSYNENGEGMIFFQGSTDFGWRFPEIRVYTTEPKRLAKEDDILLSVRAPVGTMNKAMRNCCIGRGLAALRSNEGYDSFLLYQMNYFKQKFDYLNSVGTTFGSLTKNELFGLELIYPDKDSLDRFEEIISSMDLKIKMNSRENIELSDLRDWLLPMLMNGQLGAEN